MTTVAVVAMFIAEDGPTPRSDPKRLAFHPLTSARVYRPACFRGWSRRPFLWFRNSSIGIDRSRARRTSSLYFAEDFGSTPRRDKERFLRSSTAALKLWTDFRARRRRRAIGESAYAAHAMTEAIESKQTRTTIKLIEIQFSPKFSGSMGARGSRRGDPEGARFRITSLESKANGTNRVHVISNALV